MWLCDRFGLQPPVAMEMRYSLMTRAIEEVVVPACQAFNVGITAYRPLVGGLLAGVYKPGEPPPAGSRAAARRGPGPAYSEAELQAAARVSALAREWGHTPAATSLAWLLSRPILSSAIVGPETPAQLDEMLPAVDLHLDAGQLEQLEMAVK